MQPDYIGFVFAPRSKRAVAPEQAAALKALLDPAIQAVGVFVDEAPGTILSLLEKGVIDMAQLHGEEDRETIRWLQKESGKPVLRAFQVRRREDVARAEQSPADLVLLDSGAGTGTPFDWGLLEGVRRPYLLAGGLTPENVAAAVEALRPWGVDVSSGIETAGKKDTRKMAAFVAAVRKEEKL